MNPDNPETLSLDESEWDETEMEDVFVPSVRVQLGWADVESAVQRGEIVPAAAYALWAYWASPGSPNRLRSDAANGAGVQPVNEQALANTGSALAAAPLVPGTALKPSPLVMVLVALVSALVGGVLSTVALLFSTH